MGIHKKIVTWTHKSMRKISYLAGFAKDVLVQMLSEGERGTDVLVVVAWLNRSLRGEFTFREEAVQQHYRPRLLNHCRQLALASTDVTVYGS
jgi:hypothetical protein